jgi:hypothetical protein
MGSKEVAANPAPITAVVAVPPPDFTGAGVASMLLGISGPPGGLISGFTVMSPGRGSEVGTKDFGLISATAPEALPKKDLKSGILFIEG